MKIKTLWGFVGNGLLLGADSNKVKAGVVFEEADDEYAHALIGKGLAVELDANGNPRVIKPNEIKPSFPNEDKASADKAAADKAAADKAAADKAAAGKASADKAAADKAAK
jgi:membrane protein involved in colicin uptake